MTTATLATPGPAAPVLQHAPGGLALALQEAFTVAARLRTRRQAVPDADSFRARIKQLVATADEEARREGYAPEYVRLAVYAYIAFLDESVLNSGLPVFSEWPRQPLQEEIFGDHMAGETFFKFLEDLLARQDSPDLADVLEVFLLCMLLGYRGKYSAGGQGGLQSLIATSQEKILRVRGGRSELSPAWRPPQEVIVTTRDPWVRRLVIVTLCALGLALVLFVVFKIALHAGVSDIEALAARLAS